MGFLILAISVPVNVVGDIKDTQMHLLFVCIGKTQCCNSIQNLTTTERRWPCPCLSVTVSSQSKTPAMLQISFPLTRPTEGYTEVRAARYFLPPYFSPVRQHSSNCTAPATLLCFDPEENPNETDLDVQTVVSAAAACRDVGSHPIKVTRQRPPPKAGRRQGWGQSRI